MEQVPDSLSALLRVDAVERCRALEFRATTLRHSEFASENPKLLLRLYERLGSALREHLEASKNPRLDDVRSIDDFVCELAAHLRYAEAALSSKLPWSLPRPLDNLLKRFIPGATMMLRPQWTHNFSIILQDLRSYYRDSVTGLFPDDHLDKIFRCFPPGFYVVSFPAIERLNVFLHCDLAHEIGHLVAEAYLQQESTRYIQDFGARLRKRFPNATTAEMQEWLSETVTFRRRAVEELTADIFAMKCLGPAAFLALASMLIGDNLDRQPAPERAYYPPGRYRLRVAFQTLRFARLLPSQNDSLPMPFDPLNEYFDRAEECIRVKSDQDGIVHGNALARIAYDSVRDAIPKIRAFLRTRYRRKFIRRERLYAEVTQLVDRLQAGIPPNEVREADAEADGSQVLHAPAQLESILNAAWFYRLVYLERKNGGEAESSGPKDPRTLSRLTLKAIELARVQAEYLQWEGGR